MVRCLVLLVIAFLGPASGVGCNPVKDGGPPTAQRPTTPTADWNGRTVIPQPPPPGWSVWDSGDGIRVATPAVLRPQPGSTPDMSILQGDHAGVRYQVTDGIDPPQVTGPFKPAEFFEAFFDNFASSGGFRRDGPTEKLRVGGHPAAQARFTDGRLRGVVRVVRLGNRTVSLALVSSAPVEEGNPVVGGYLNSLQLEKPAQ